MARKLANGNSPNPNSQTAETERGREAGVPREFLNFFLPSPDGHSAGFPCGSAGTESACNVGNLGSTPGLGRSPGEEKGRRRGQQGTRWLEGVTDSMDMSLGELREW